MPADAPPAPPPLPNSYWVIPGRLLAGEHPGAGSPELTRQRVQQLLAAGIDCFIDLTMPGELEPYDPELPLEVEYLRKPIRDHGLPAERAHMVEILGCLTEALGAGRRVYVHCRAGIGRTGMVMGCLLAEQGLAGDAALAELNRLWQRCGRSRTWDFVPETPDQIEYVQSWAPALAPRTAAVPALAAHESAGAEPVAPAAATLRERYLGALVGLAVGDALAVATQQRRPGTFAPVEDLLGGGPYELPRGAWSDDTAMALCLAESLLACGGFDPRDQVERYTRWQQQGYLSATGQCVGITASTARALALARWRRQLFSGSHDPKQRDPEPLSRVAPAVLFFFDSRETAVQSASDAARTTCQSPHVLDACRLLGVILHAALAGAAKEELLAPGPERLGGYELRPQIAALARGAYRKLEPPAVRAGDSAGEVLRAALWAFACTDTFRDGALRVANLGESSDVAAAVYGQLAGAHYGLGAIPERWRNALMRKDLIAGFATRLFAQARPGGRR